MSEILLKGVMALAKSWARLHTMGTDPESAERRRAEFESDLWESAHGEGAGDAPFLTAIEILDRLIRGIPSDLVWRLEAGHGPSAPVSSGASASPRPLTRAGTILFRTIAIVAVLGALFEVTQQLLRVADFQAAVPLEESWQVALVVAAYCVPPVTALAACVLALPLVIRAEQLEEARTLALFLAFMSLFWATVFSFFYFLPSTEPDQLNFGMSAGPGASAWAYTWYVLAIVSFLRFSALFPRRLSARDSLRMIQRVSMLPSMAWGMGAVLILAIAAPAIGNPFTRGSEPWTRGAPPIDITWNALWILRVLRMALGYVVVPLGMIAMGVLNLLSGLRGSTGRDRSRVLWIFAGFSTAMWMVVLAIPLALIGDAALPRWLTAWSIPMVLLAPAVIVGCLAVAVFYRGDLDPALMIRRSTVYGSLALVFVAVLASGESLLSDFLVDRVGLPDAAGGALLAGVTATLLVPLRTRVRGWVDRIGHRGERATESHPWPAATRASLR